jgi:hypothetical protein
MTLTDALFWVFLANAIALVLHEMDAVHWQEWEMFGLPGHEPGFLSLHIPLLAMTLLGLVGVADGIWWGLAIGLAVGLSGLFAFGIHTYQLRRGMPVFNTSPSRLILWATLLLSIPQVVLSLIGLV